MAGLKQVKGYEEYAVNICPNNTSGEIIEIGDVLIQLPEAPKDEEILNYGRVVDMQMWRRLPVPEELRRIRSMDEWYEMPSEFKKRFSPYIEQEFKRRREGVWFFNNGKRIYITGRHYMMLQWSKLDIGYGYYLEFQRRLFLHFAACEADPRSMGQMYTKCRRSGYTNMSAAILVDEGTQVKDKLLGIQSKTGKDAQENIFMKKVVLCLRAIHFSSSRYRTVLLTHVWS